MPPSKREVIVSVIVCTCDRAESFARTFAALSALDVPAGTTCELIVVNNGACPPAAAATATTFFGGEQSTTNGSAVRWLREPLPGKSRAINRALAVARGDILVFTDDDVIPPRDWLVRLCAPVLDGTAEAVTGAVRLAPHLERPWLTPDLRAWVASTETLDPVNPSRMLGGNMAFTRSVLGKVPAFDPELGPGALGYGEDTLFSEQLKAAGCRVAGVFDARVEHHFQARRLDRPGWLEAAQKMGRTDAYLAHHWEHARWARPHWLVLKAALRFLACRARSRRDMPPAADPALPRLAAATRHLHACLHYLRERRKPRHYARHGAIKLSGLRADGV